MGAATALEVSVVDIFSSTAVRGWSVPSPEHSYFTLTLAFLGAHHVLQLLTPVLAVPSPLWCDTENTASRGPTKTQQTGPLPLQMGTPLTHTQGPRARPVDLYLANLPRNARPRRNPRPYKVRLTPLG